MIMKMRSLFLAVCMTSVAVVAAARQEQPLTVAVFDFASRDAGVKDLGPKLSAVLTALLSANPDVITVERQELDKALGEQELGLSGTVSPDTAARVGNLTGAKVLVTGRVFKVDKNTMAVAKVIGTETGRVFGETATIPESSDLAALSESLAKKISSALSSKGDLLVANTESREERIKKLTAAARSSKSLAVSVSLPEQHFGAPAADPAAETELLALLKEAGYKIVDSKSDKRADIEITGEAFSAFGMRKGNLYDCKARIELKARRRNGGKILFTGSHTSVAADLTEQTAAKSALENAALDVAQRLFPALSRL